MSYDEYGEWHRAADGMTEMQRAATEVDVRMSMGLVGDREDARD